MAIPNNFKRPTATAAVAAQAAAGRPASRFAGVKLRPPKPLYPKAGTYQFRVLSCVEGTHPVKRTHSMKCLLEVTEVHGGDQEVGDVVFMSQSLMTDPGIESVKAFALGALGFADEEAFDAVDEGTGELLDACLGSVNAHSGPGGVSPLVGRLVYAQVDLGKPIPGSSPPDHYRNYQWSPSDQ